MITGSLLSDYPNDNDQCVINIYKISTQRGYAIAIGKGSGVYFMHLNSSGGLSGIWNKIAYDSE